MTTIYIEKWVLDAMADPKHPPIGGSLRAYVHAAPGEGRVAFVPADVETVVQAEPSDEQVAMLDPWMRPAAARELLRKILRSALAAPAPALAAPAEPLQGGMSNDALAAAWSKKVPGVTPTDHQLTAFALGIEVGFAHARELERQDWDRVHHALEKHGKHPGRTDDHLADVIDRVLTEAEMLNGLTESETAQTASVAGLVDVPCTFKRQGESDDEWIERITGATPAAAPAPQPEAPADSLLLQDCDRKLSQALAGAPHARRHATEAAQDIAASSEAHPVPPGFWLAPDEPRVTGAPETIWLVYGDLDRDATHWECCRGGEVAWCEDAQFSADVRYLRADLLYQEARQIAARALEDIANEPPVSGNDIAQARVLLAAAQLRGAERWR